MASRPPKQRQATGQVPLGGDQDAAHWPPTLSYPAWREQMGTGAGWTPQEVWGYGAWGTLCSLLAGPEAGVRAGPGTLSSRWVGVLETWGWPGEQT